MAVQCAPTTRAANPVVFIGGCPRSGTTLLQRMLDHHPELAIANDTHFVPRALEIVDRDLLSVAESGDEIALTDELSAAVWNYHRFYRLGIERANFEAAAARSSTYQQLVAELFAVFTSGRGKRFGGEKTPDYVRHAPALLGMFPDAKFIHIVRDGRNAALSLRQWATETKGPGRLAYWDTDPLAVSALWWQQFVKQTPALGGIAERYYVIRYEQLVEEPVESLQKICSFLELPYAPSMVRFHEGKPLSSNGKSAKSQWLPATSGLRDWRRDMAAEDIAVFEALAGDSLLAHGYELSGSASGEFESRVDRARAWWNSPGRKRRPRKGQEAIRSRHDTASPSAPSAYEDDAALMSADPQLENAITLLNDEEFHRLVRGADFHSHQRLAEVHANYVRYKRGTNCLVRYAFPDGSPFGYAVAYRADAEDKLKNAQQYLRRVGAAYGFVDVHRRIAFYRYPVDPRLPQLSELLDPQNSRTLRGLLPDNVALEDLAMSCLSFKPGRRCIVQVSRGGVPFGVIRMFLPRDYLRARRAAKYVPTEAWHRGELLNQSDRHSALLMRWVEGSPMQPFDRYAVGIARLLNQIHGRPQPKLPVAKLSTHLEALKNNVTAVAELIPQLRTRVQGLGDIAARALQSASHQITLCHGDFHTGQIVCHHGALSVVDWDNAQNDSAGFDLGTFAAHAILETIRSDGDIAATTQLLEELEDEYCAVRGVPPAALAADGFVIDGILAIATHPFRQRDANWRARTNRLVDVAEQRAARLAARRPKGAALPHPLKATSLVTPIPREDKPWLEQPLSSSAVSNSVLPVIRNHLDASEVQLAEIEVLSHKVHRRCAARYVVLVDNAPVEQREALQHRSFVAKVRKKGLDVLGADLQHRLFLRTRDAGLSLRVAEPLGCFAEWGMWLQAELEGRSADDVTLATSDTDVSRRIGVALAELHNLDLGVEREHSFDDEYAILERCLQRVAAKRRELADQIQRISAGCRALLAHDDPSQWTGIHRDFYPAQVLCAPKNVGIVDLDLLSRGHPAIDVGNYIAHLKEMALRRYNNAQELAAHESAFTDGYLSRSPTIERKTLDAVTLASLARHIFISRRIANRRRTTTSLVALCEHLLDGYRREYGEYER